MVADYVIKKSCLSYNPTKEFDDVMYIDSYMILPNSYEIWLIR